MKKATIEVAFALEVDRPRQSELNPLKTDTKRGRPCEKLEL